MLSLIAIMLGRLEMDIDECIKAYIEMSDRIFQKKRLLLGWNGDIQGRFDTAELESSIKRMIFEKKGNIDEKMRPDTPEPDACKVYVSYLQHLDMHVVNVR
jgi:hypothetical protein